jgi:hypothetical protein
MFFIYCRYSRFICCVDGYNHIVLYTQQDAIYKVCEDSFNYWGWTLGTAATTGLLYQPRMIGDSDCGDIGGMKIFRGNRSTRRKPTPAPICPPQIPHVYTRV